MKITKTFAEKGVKYEGLDTIIIKLDYEGEFTLPNSLVFNKQNVIIYGKSEKTKLILDEGFEFVDDCIIGVLGDKTRPVNEDDNDEGKVSVDIHDLTIECKFDPRDCNFTKDNQKPFANGFYAVKIYNASSVSMKSVKIHLEDFPGTNVDIRRGKNITISDCELINYNRQKIGGGLWLRGDLQHVNINHNIIRKYGNDEALAIWSVNNYTGTTDGATELRKEHIYITGNEFHNEIVPYIPTAEQGIGRGGEYSRKTSEADTSIGVDTGIIGDWDGANDRFLTFFTNQDDNRVKDDDGITTFSKTPINHVVNDVHIDGNDFYMDAPVKVAATFSFDTFTDYHNVSFNDNKVIYSNWERGTFDQNTFYGTMDVSVLYDVCYGDGNELEERKNHYSGSCDSPVEVCRNLFMSDCHVGVYGDTENHVCLHAIGTNVIFNDNTINYTYSKSYSYPLDFAKAGYTMLLASEKTAKVTAHRNWATGLQTLMTASGSSAENPIEFVSLEARENHLEGDTRIFTRNVRNASYNMSGNYIKSDYELCALLEQATNQSVTFKGNVVERNVINASRDKAFVYDAGYEKATYLRCQIVATGNTFIAANSACTSEDGNVFSRFSQTSNRFVLYAEKNATGSKNQE